MAQEKIEFTHFARLVLDALEEAGIDYLIGGAVAVWAWGAPRSTQDFDVVIDLPGNRIMQLSRELEKRDMLVPAEVILELFINTDTDLPINAIHLQTGHKAELFLIPAGGVFRKVAFERRCMVDFGPPLGQVYVHTPEDLILNKVHYFSLSEQSKHVRDIASILELLDSKIDMDYLEEWAAELHLTETWTQIQALIAQEDE